MSNENLVEQLIRGGYLRTPEVVEAFRKVDRKLFVPQPREAYEDHPLPIPGGQTISAPHMVAIMLELLELKSTDQVLEIGAGSGYNAALMAALSKRVCSIELDDALVEFARKNLRKAEIMNTEVIHGDGSKGIPGRKWDKIVFTCGVREIPKKIISQLKDSGILIAPVGNHHHQELTLLRKEKGKTSKELHGGCIFVPLRPGSVETR